MAKNVKKPRAAIGGLHRGDNAHAQFLREGFRRVRPHLGVRAA
jgi:hypothetical protein